MMSFGVSVISERNHILTLKKLELVLQANQWRRIFVTLVDRRLGLGRNLRVGWPLISRPGL